MRSLLFVMHCRQIRRCIESIRALEIDQAWICGYPEAELGPVINGLVDGGGYDRYLIVSDDAVVDQFALNCVLAAHDLVKGVVTGWCQYAENDDRANLSLAPLRTPAPMPSSYSPPTASDVCRGPLLFRTYFAGMALTCMTRELWQQYPFDCFGADGGVGWASDYSLSIRLQNAGIPITAVRDGYIHHAKSHWNVTDSRPEHRVLVGEMAKEVRLHVLAVRR